MLELIALAIIILGFILIILGVLTGYKKFEEDFEEEKAKRDVKAGGVILIGPIPIVFGESRYAVYALILTIVLMVMAIIFMFSLRI